MPKIIKPNVAVVYHCTLQVLSVLGIIKMCSCLDTTSASLISCNAILVTKDFYFVYVQEVEELSTKCLTPLNKAEVQELRD